jgi:hypothetical protein
VGERLIWLFPRVPKALVDLNEQARHARSLYAIYNSLSMTPTEPSSELRDLDAFLDDPLWERIASFGTGTEPSAGVYYASSEDDHHPTNGQPFKLPAPPRRGRPPKRWDKEAALDLWLHVPPGYVRDGRGRWRYEATGTAVPGARDATLATLYSFASEDDMLLVPVDLVRGRDELGWCARLAVGERDVVVGRRAQRVFKVPRPQWEARCHAPLGLDAPELMPDRLLSLAGVARLAGVSYQTAASYFSRREVRFPEAVARLAGNPVWSEPVVRSWLTSRPGKGGQSSGDKAAKRPPRGVRRQPFSWVEPATNR